MNLKLYDYEILVLKEFFKYCFAKSFASFNGFLNYYPYIQRDINKSGEFLLMRHLKNIEEDMKLCNVTVEAQSQDLKNGAEFIMWIGKDTILLEGYSFENRWLHSDSKIRLAEVRK